MVNRMFSCQQTLAALAPAALLVLVLGGCGGRGEPLEVTQRDALDTIEIGAFVGPVTEPEAAPPWDGRAASPFRVVSADSFGDAAAVDEGSSGDGFEDGMSAAPADGAGFGPSLFAGDPSLAVSRPTLVNSKVGDINGLPIFADEFLEPLSGQLEAEARRLSRREWILFANDLIESELNELLLDELLRAEALARLTPEQQTGFRGFLETIRRDLLSQNYGSRQIAERRLQERAGISEEEFIEQQRQTSLIQATLRDQIGKRVSVSWRDIEQRYERDIDRFRPDPAAAYRIIRVRDEDVSEVTERLAAGEPYELVASGAYNTFEPDSAGLRIVQFEGPRAEADLFGGPLNEIAQGLGDGEVSEPVKIGSSTYWMKLEGVSEEIVSLYDAQLQIAAQIEGERTYEELNRFLGRMVERADIGSIADIQRRLLFIAGSRYAPAPDGSVP